MSDFIDDQLEHFTENHKTDPMPKKHHTCIKKYFTPCFIIFSISAVLLCILNKYYTSPIPQISGNDNMYCNAFFNTIKPFLPNQEDSAKMLILSYCHENIEKFESFCEKNECLPLIKDYHFLLEHFAKLNKYCSEILFDY